MTRDDQAAAYRAASELVRRLKPGSRNHRTAMALVGLLQLPPTMADILLRVPGATVTAKVRAIGISRPHYYTLRDGQTRPSPALAYKLAALTGVPESSIRG